MRDCVQRLGIVQEFYMYMKKWEFLSCPCKNSYNLFHFYIMKSLKKKLCSNYITLNHQKKKNEGVMLSAVSFFAYLYDKKMTEISPFNGKVFNHLLWYNNQTLCRYYIKPIILNNNVLTIFYLLMEKYDFWHFLQTFVQTLNPPKCLNFDSL